MSGQRAHALANLLPVGSLPAAATKHPPAPVGIRGRVPVRLVHDLGLGPGTHGVVLRWPDHATVLLSSATVYGLHANEREAWLTVFHEAAHVVFGDIVATPAREKRAEAFAEFMLSFIQRAMRLAPLNEARKRAEDESFEWFNAELARLGIVFENGEDFDALPAEHLREVLQLMAARSTREREFMRKAGAALDAGLADVAPGQSPSDVTAALPDLSGGTS